MSQDESGLLDNSYDAEAYKVTNEEFKLVWSNLFYRLYPSKLSQLVNRLKGYRRLTGHKTILRDCSGSLRSGRLTAIMGPSGAGKSTLIECLIGLKVNNVEGEIRLVELPSKVSISYLPQEDQLYELLSVRESITFAYKLKAIAKGESPDNYVRIKNRVDAMMSQLDLISCSEQSIVNISGGQKKRVSIAQELISSPDILVLDEPSSGLDSSTCYSLIKLLRSLAKQLSIIIAVTVHQPSARTFNLFQDVYMLSANGRIMFTGEPSQVIPTLLSVGIVVEPLNNPVDVLIEVASGDYGYEKIDQLVQKAEKKEGSEEFPKFYGSAHGKRLVDSVFPYQGSFFKATNLLTKRATLNISRNQKLIWIRALVTLNLVVMIGSLYYGVGVSDGCVSSKMIEDIKSGQFSSIHQEIESLLWDTRDNISSFYFVILFIAFCNILTPCSRLPMEMPLFVKESFNGWFSARSYFTSQFLADQPFCFCTLIATFIGHFYFTSQPIDRCLQLIPIFLLLNLVSYLNGLFVSIIFMDNLHVSIFYGANTIVPLLLLSGFFIRIYNMPAFYRILSNFSYIRLIFEGLSIALLGHNKCEHGEEFSRVINESREELEVFLNSMFKIASRSIDQLSTSEQSKILNNQTAMVTKAIIGGFDIPYFPKDGSSVILKTFNFTDELYYQSIWKLSGLVLLTTISILVAIKYRSKRAG